MAFDPSILTLAADKLDAGHWIFADAAKADEKHRDLALLIYGAAAELGRRDNAYDTMMAVGRHLLGQDFRSPLYRTPGIVQGELVCTLRSMAYAVAA